MKQLNCILLIDDNEDDNLFHTLVIKKCQAAARTIAVTTGEKGLDYLEAARREPDRHPCPDLIFLDINMPGINGFEFLERARDKGLIEERRTTVIVMLTSSLNPGDEKTAREKFAHEITEYRNKPLTADMLQEIIERMV